MSTIECPVCHSPSHFFCSKNGYNLYKCSSCKLGFLSPIPTEKEVTDYYNNSNYYQSTNHGYLNYEALENGLKTTYRKFIHKLFIEYKFVCEGKNILDIGCAHGFFLDVTKEKYASECWGIDISKDAKSVMDKKGYHFFEGAFENIDLPENYFDLVYMGDVFEHFMNPFDAMKKLSRILKPGGIILLTTLDFNSLFVNFTGKNWRLITPPEHIYYWTKPSVQQLSKTNNFECRFITSMHHLPKEYISFRFKKQFGFDFWPLKLIPGKTLPIPGFDTMTCLLRKV